MTKIRRLFNIFWDCKNSPLIPPAIYCNQSKTPKIIKSLKIGDKINTLKFSNKVSIYLLIVYSLVLLFYLYFKNPILAGDGHEYLGMTASFFNHLSPDLQEKDIILRNYVENKNGIYLPASYDNYVYFKSLNGSYYSWHFWIYSLINLLSFSFLHCLRMNELRCFPITNYILLISSLGVILFCLKNNVQKIIMVSFSAFSPILLYLNWPHPEVFSYSFIVMAISFAFRENYKFSVLLSSIASLQNPPIAILTFYLIFIGWKEKKWNLKELLLLLFSSIISTIPYLFYYLNYHTFSLITYEGFASGANISFGKILSLFFDLNFGMIVYIPALVLLSILSLFLSIQKKDLKIISLWVVLILMALVSSTQENWNSGMMYINRYTVYMIPVIILITVSSIKYYSPNKLKIILFIGFMITVSSTIFYLVDYDTTNYIKFNELSNAVLVVAPGYYNPPYDVFAERALGGEYNYSANLPIIYTYNGSPRKILTDYEHIHEVENLIEPQYKEKVIENIKKSKIGYINSHKILWEFPLDKNKLNICSNNKLAN